MKYFISKHVKLDTQAIIDAKNQEIKELKKKLAISNLIYTNYK